MKQASKSARESLLRCSYISTFRRRRFVAFSFSIHKHPWMQPQPAAALTSHKLCDPRACVDDSIYENFDKFQHFNKRASIWSRLKWMWLLIWIYKSLSSGRYQDFNKKSMNINTIGIFRTVGCWCMRMCRKQKNARRRGTMTTYCKYSAVSNGVSHKNSTKNAYSVVLQRFNSYKTLCIFICV